MPNYVLFLQDDPAAFASLSPGATPMAAGQVVGGHKLRDGSGKGA